MQNDGIESNGFYCNKKSRIDNPLLLFNAPGRIFQSFSRQENAFEYFDSLPCFLKVGCKLFSYESIHTGQRKFLVANFNVFCFEYFTLIESKEYRHAYEIIRDNFPCRLYFDLEYSIRDNPNINQDVLLSKWIGIVAWKLHSLFGLAIGTHHVLVLDSTTDEKFSKHVIFVLSSVQDTKRHSTTSTNNVEYLFANNAEVGNLLQLILMDVTESYTYDASSIDNKAVVISFNGHRRVVKPTYRDLWLNTPDSSNNSDECDSTRKQTCFVDLGVYSRNRAFRLFASCKYGKSQQLHHSIEDARKYTAFSTHKKSTDLFQMRCDLLKKSLVVPHDVFSITGNDEVGLNNQKYVLLPLVSSVSNMLTIGGAPVAMTLHSHISSTLNRHPANNKSLQGNVIARSLHFRESSWFPQLDQHIAEHFANIGGQKGVLTSWTLSKSTQMLLPPPPLSRFCTDNSLSAASAASDALTDKQSPREYVFYKLKYQVSGNRWCGNIGRAHKSNGTMLEVDLTRREVTQTCWDTDCKGYRSPSQALLCCDNSNSTADADGGSLANVTHCLDIPLDADVLHEFIVNRCVEIAAKADPEVWG